MTLKKFRSSPALTAGLGEIMKNPTLKLALETIKEDCLIRTPCELVPGVHADTTQTHHLYRQMGVLHVIESLERMTREGKEREADEEEFPLEGKEFQKFEINP